METAVLWELILQTLCKKNSLLFKKLQQIYTYIYIQLKATKQKKTHRRLRQLAMKPHGFARTVEAAKAAKAAKASALLRSTSEVELEMTPLETGSGNGTRSGASGSQDGLVAADTHLDRKAFELSDALTNEALSESRTFNFCRSARKSILLSLGVSPQSATPATQDILTPYSKASNQACMNAYMAVVLGPGTFRLSRAISRCGWSIGFGALLCLCLMHIFICLRLVEVPQLIQQDVPNATFLAKVFLERRAYRIVAILSVLSWFGACSIQLQNVVSNILTVVAFDVAEYANFHRFRDTTPFGWKLFAAIMLAVTVVPLSLKSSAKDLQTKASYAVYSMLAIGAVESSCAFVHGIYGLKSEVQNHGPEDYDSVGSNIAGGLFDMALAFGGIAILPYVLADMLQPENAREVVIKATTRIMFFYLACAMIGYFGWANTIKIMTPLQLMMSMSWGYQNCARIISSLRRNL